MRLLSDRRGGWSSNCADSKPLSRVDVQRARLAVARLAVARLAVARRIAPGQGEARPRRVSGCVLWLGCWDRSAVKRFRLPKGFRPNFLEGGLWSGMPPHRLQIQAQTAAVVCLLIPAQRERISTSASLVLIVQPATVKTVSRLSTHPWPTGQSYPRGRYYTSSVF